MLALVDCNNFYISCERVFNPSLERQPVIILSEHDGCVIARSEEAKLLGIKMATPGFMMEDLVRDHDVKVFSTNYSLYLDMNARVMEILSGFTRSIRRISVEETLLDLSFVNQQDLPVLAETIRQTIQQYTGLPVTVGVAPTKTLAKLASRYAKKKKHLPGIHCSLSPVQIQELLDHSKITEVWGIGREHEKLLLKHHVKTAGDFVKMPEEWVGKNLSEAGQRMLNELCGLPATSWEDQLPPKKGLQGLKSYGYPSTKKLELAEDSISYGSSGYQKKRKRRALQPSRKYTTDINQLLTIKI